MRFRPQNDLVDFLSHSRPFLEISKSCWHVSRWIWRQKGPVWGRGLCDGETEALPETACLAARPICSRISKRAPGTESSTQLCGQRGPRLWSPSAEGTGRPGPRRSCRLTVCRRLIHLASLSSPLPLGTRFIHLQIIRAEIPGKGRP